MGDKFIATLESKCSSYGQQSTPLSSPACYFQKGGSSCSTSCRGWRRESFSFTFMIEVNKMSEHCGTALHLGGWGRFLKSETLKKPFGAKCVKQYCRLLRLRKLSGSFGGPGDDNRLLSGLISPQKTTSLNPD